MAIFILVSFSQTVLLLFLRSERDKKNATMPDCLRPSSIPSSLAASIAFLWSGVGLFICSSSLDPLNLSAPLQRHIHNGRGIEGYERIKAVL